MDFWTQTSQIPQIFRYRALPFFFCVIRVPKIEM